MALAAVRYPVQDWWVLDRSYQRTGLGPDVTAWLDYLELGGASPNTVDQYERTLARLCHGIPCKKLKDVTDGDLTRLLRSYPPKSRAQRKAALSKFFWWAVVTRRIKVNPTQYLPQIKKTPSPQTTMFTDVEQELLLALPLIDSVLMCILLDTGIRKEGARNLQVRHAPVESRYLVVEREKGGAGRAVTMSGRLRAKLSELILLEGLNDTDYLWYDRPGGARRVRRSKPIGDVAYHRWWGRCLEQAGVAYRRPHTTRHTYANSLRREGAGLDYVKVLLGHKDIRTTETYYLHPSIDEISDRLAELNPDRWA